METKHLEPPVMKVNINTCSRCGIAQEFVRPGYLKPQMEMTGSQHILKNVSFADNAFAAARQLKLPG